MTKFPGVVEQPRRNSALFFGVLAGAPLISLSLLAYHARITPTGAKVAISLFVMVELALVLMRLFPRTYLLIDEKGRVATFVNRGHRKEMPIEDLHPLQLRTIDRPRSHGRVNRSYRVESAAAPVIFHSGRNEEKAMKRLQQLNRRFGFEKTEPEENELSPEIPLATSAPMWSAAATPSRGPNQPPNH